MLLETEVGEIATKGFFDEWQNHDPNMLINSDLNEEVTLWLFVWSASKTSTITHNWVGKVENFPSDIYNWAMEDKQL